jgi:urea carboxylase
LAADASGAEAQAIEVPVGADLIEAPFGGSVWKLLVAPGDVVVEGDVIAVIEAMKMECPFESPVSGTVEALYITELQALHPGAPMLALRRH